MPLLLLKQSRVKIATDDLDKGKVFSTDLGKGEVFSSGANKGKVFPGISVNFPLLIAVLRDVLGFKTR